jgi:hypothetical protein
VLRSKTCPNRVSRNVIFLILSIDAVRSADLLLLDIRRLDALGPQFYHSKTSPSSYSSSGRHFTT